MGATDVSAHVRALVLAETEKQAFGEEFGVDVGWDVVPTPAGPQIGYRIVLTARAPLLGQGPLFAVAPLLTPRPEVAEAVTVLMRQLREASAQLLRSPAPAG